MNVFDIFDIIFKTHPILIPSLFFLKIITEEKQFGGGIRISP